ncbi:MAG: alpha/beta hydrolase [Bacteroidota bacterium]
MRLLFFLLCLLIGTTAHSQKRFFQLDEGNIWINTIGIENRQPGQPVIVLESGLGTPMDHWDKVLDGLSQLAPVVAYDRPGIGESPPIDEMPTTQNVADRLVRLLDQLQLEPPYVLVGHSMGGLYARSFAIHYPQLLAGLVCIDPADFTETQQNQRAYYEVLNWTDAKVDSLIQSFIDRRKNGRKDVPLAIKREGQVLEKMREEDFAEIINTPLVDVPVHMLMGGRYEKPRKFWSKEYDEEALFRSKTKYRMQRWTEVVQSVSKGMLFYSGDAGHFIHYEDPELLISSIRIMLQDIELMKQKKKN